MPSTVRASKQHPSCPAPSGHLFCHTEARRAECISMHREARVRKPSARSVLPTVSCVPASRELVSGGPLPRQVADFFSLTPCSPRGGICPYGACRGRRQVCATRASRCIIPARRQDGISGNLVFPECWPGPFWLFLALARQTCAPRDGSWGRLDTKPQALLTPCRPWRQQCPPSREDATALRS